MVIYENLRFTVKTPIRTLQEFPFDGQEPDALTHTVYLETPPENEPQTFVVEVSRLQDIGMDLFTGAEYYGSKLKLSVDGIHGALCDTLKENNPPTITMKGLYLRSNPQDPTAVVQHEVSFARINKTDDEGNICDVLDDMARQTGVIEITIWEYAAGNQKIHLWTPAIPYTLGLAPSNYAFHEKQMKGSSATHTVRLGNAVSALNSTPASTSMMVNNNGKKLRFLYRSRATLENLGVITPPPFPQGIPMAPVAQTFSTGFRVLR
ncbi:hypothetical protein BJ508DRAFT_325568 [Ascobolus immersus RN42]|uniref:DUF7918 domain-containing protein n=1 Tax=Ascobolus immersus RN42 TaxID=1160509 RepID=A0A3N4I889_ASCIM|nr:hypothetical protein BJ508DRAFT_325568 [Ascobolus immersus RN42]